ncbi:hypothetical protein U1Q18_016839 [Sarracenia purpurea var. burkii]
MKAGGCKDEFIAWEKCIDEAEKNQEDVEKCFEITGALKSAWRRIRRTTRRFWRQRRRRRRSSGNWRKRKLKDLNLHPCSRHLVIRKIDRVWRDQNMIVCKV